ncbi:NAD(P)/FAD-dependent oxidoreductase [Amycolatopsis sp. NPDC058986]|uniref:FAD/NAD(P)-dependent oxidoreductase n=1 Tax=unclassified Amycolatopsis TaxID=2618356 RepID=UPI003671D96D
MSAVVVVGAGPAGTAAAEAAASAGCRVVLIDSAARLGGQFHRQDSLQDTEKFVLHHNVEHLAGTAVAGLEPLERGHRLHLRTGQADGPQRIARSVDTTALVLATGAYDRALPFPGWELPGVYTAGAAQALAKGQRVAVGKRVLLAGTGPFLLPVADSLLDIGAQLVGVLEANSSGMGWLREPAALFAGHRKAAELAGYVRMLGRHRVPYRSRTTVIAAHGRDRVEAVTTARLDHEWRVRSGSERRFAVNAVCVGFGFLPQLELAVSAGCALDGGFVMVNAAQATSVPGVFAAGELTGIGGADLAAAEGTVAGIAAAQSLGASVGVPHRALRQVKEGRTFAEGLARAYPVRNGWRTWLDDDTLVCRCEEVSRRELLDSVERRDALGVRSLKLVSRAGLGLCQGRICGRNVAELTGTSPDGFARRPIAAPIRLGELSEVESPWEGKA